MGSRHMKPLVDFTDQLRAAGHAAQHDWVENEWVFIVDDAVVARGGNIGDMLDAARKWWRRTITPTTEPK